MKKNAAILSVIFLIFSGTACGKATGPSEGLRVETGRGQIKEIYFNDTPVFRGNGGYYIIGNCPGNSGDGPDNVISTLKDGVMSSTSGHCREIPFTMDVRTESDRQAVIVEITIGPAPPDYVFSLPFDSAKAVFDRFEFGGVSSYSVGCGGGWSERSGSGGYFKDVPANCFIPGLGGVGAARSFSAAFLLISGSGMKIRRTILSGGAREFLFYNHPGTNNMEIGLCCSSYYRLREEIVFSAS